MQNVCKYTKIWYLNFLWNHSFKTIYLYSIGKLLAFGWPNKRRINFILEHSASIKSELYPQERCISGVYIYPQMSSPMLSPLSAWGLYKLASARVSRSEIGFTWQGQCNNDVRSYFYNVQQTWNMNNEQQQKSDFIFPLTMDVQNLLYLSWSPPLAHSGAVQELLKTKRGATCTGGGGHLVTVTQLQGDRAICSPALRCRP